VIGPGGYRWLAAFGLLAAVPLGANLFLAARRAEMSLAGELFGIAGLSLGAPAMYYVAAGSAQPQMAGLWLLSFLYFGGTVFYVRLKVRVHARQDAPQGYLQRLLIGRTAVIYHFGVLVLTAFLVTTGLVPLFAPLAYVPATCKAVQGVLAWQRPVSVKRIGVIEIIHSLSFALLVIIACYV
jgi:hypothetical protein